MDELSEIRFFRFVPNLFKAASVTHIHKSGSKIEFKNDRPIFILTFLNKVVERVLHSRTSKSYHKDNVIYENQFGFLSNKSINDVILIYTLTQTFIYTYTRTFIHTYVQSR